MIINDNVMQQNISNATVSFFFVILFIALTGNFCNLLCRNFLFIADGV